MASCILIFALYIAGGIVNAKMQKVIVTGATSMIGAALLESLVLDDDINRIYAVVRPSSEKICRIPVSPKITVVECDIHHYEKLVQVIPIECDCFFHLAWNRTSTYDESIGDIHMKIDCVQASVNAVQVAKKLGCGKFIGVGGQSEYGIVPSGVMGPETPCNPVRADGIAKYAAYKMSRLAAEKLGIVFIWMRVFSVYGKYDRGNSLVSSTISKLYHNEHCSFTPCEQEWEYLNATDIGRAFCLVGKRVEHSAVYCVGSGQIRPLREFIETIRDVVNPSAQLGIGDFPYPENPVMKLCADISALCKDTGWRPEITFEDGIRELYAWKIKNEK